MYNNDIMNFFSFIRGCYKILKLPYVIMFNDIKSFLLGMFILPLITFAFLLPILFLGIIIGFGVQLSSYLSNLWLQSSSDTKLTVIATVIAGTFALPFFLEFLIRIFKKIRTYFKNDQLWKKQSQIFGTFGRKLPYLS